jgi:UDP-glucuronate decarboxylase
MSKIDLLNLPDFKSIFENSSLITNLSEFEQPKAVLITGAQGMLGHGLAVAINSLNGKVGVNKIQLILASRHWNESSVKFWKKYSNYDLILNDEIPNINKRIDLVIHAASPSNITRISSFEQLEWANLGLMREIFKLNPHKVVYISSGEVYGGGKTDEEFFFNGFSKDQVRDWYPITKLASESELRLFQSKHEVEVCVIRLFHTFGPGVKSNDGRSFADVLWGATLRREILLKSKGDQVRTFLYLSDAVEGIVLLAFRKYPGFNIVNLGSSTPYSIYEFAETAARLTGANIIFDTTVTFQHSPNQTIVPNVNRLSQKGWNQKVTLEDGIRRTINWIRGSTLARN